VTIPKRLRDLLRIRPGEVHDFETADAQLIARKAGHDPVDGLYGVLDLPARPDALLDELRGPRPTP
jgi:bifunctional DNA-binding transcriptional regulator/antitoxin component of YhaV-PrlF toxin-antitoxin module